MNIINNVPFKIESNNSNINDSDLDDYIDIRDKIQENYENLFQFNLNNNKLTLKHIGKCSEIPDIIIKENFGPYSNMSLYSCIYSYNEIKSSNLICPLIKLIINNNSINKNMIIISYISVKIIQPIIININDITSNINNEIIINDWELYFIENIFNIENKKYYKLDKNINPSNIIEKIIKLTID